MLSSIAAYEYFIIAKPSLNHRPGSPWWWIVFTHLELEPHLQTLSDLPLKLQQQCRYRPRMSVCLLCPVFGVFFGGGFRLMHQPLFIGPAGVMCPDSRWLCRLLLPLASQMQLFGRQTDWFCCSLSLWPGLGHSCYALLVHWHLPLGKVFSPG